MIFIDVRCQHCVQLIAYFPHGSDDADQDSISYGKALVVVIRTALIRSSRVDMTIAAASVFRGSSVSTAVGAITEPS